MPFGSSTLNASATGSNSVTWEKASATQRKRAGEAQEMSEKTAKRREKTREKRVEMSHLVGLQQFPERFLRELGLEAFEILFMISGIFSRFQAFLAASGTLQHGFRTYICHNNAEIWGKCSPGARGLSLLSPCPLDLPIGVDIRKTKNTGKLKV